jgi:hypothetical protein
MVQKARRPSGAAQARTQSRTFGLPFGRTNLILFGAGIAAIVLGFITLAFGSDTLAPVLLVLGYCVIVPAAIIWKEKRKTEGDQT